MALIMWISDKKMQHAEKHGDMIKDNYLDNLWKSC